MWVCLNPNHHGSLLFLHGNNKIGMFILVLDWRWSWIRRRINESSGTPMLRDKLSWRCRHTGSMYTQRSDRLALPNLGTSLRQPIPRWLREPLRRVVHLSRRVDEPPGLHETSHNGSIIRASTTLHAGAYLKLPTRMNSYVELQLKMKGKRIVS
jgi:hypothetical protein